MTADRRAHDPWAPPPPAAPTTKPVKPANTATPAAADTAPDADVAAMIPDDLDDITRKDLIALAELAGVATYGTKAEIAARVRGET